MEQALSKMYHTCTICTIKIPIAILKNIKCNDSYIHLNTTKECKKKTWQSLNLMYNAKSSAGFHTSAMSKASTTLGIVREYNTCIIVKKKKPKKYSSCINCYHVKW